MVRVTRHGFREMLIGSLVLAVAIYVIGEYTSGPWHLLLILPILMLIWLFAFFRDPERQIPGEQNAMVSPADGTVSDITELPNHEVFGGPAVRVGIFLSVFNVHVNRSPCDGTVISVQYKRGRFVNAMKHGTASESNESNTVVLAEPKTGKPIAIVKQIVGLIARRIICTVDVKDTVTRGQRIGMIKFGSRTELYIPKSLDPQIKVSVGQTVRGAADVIAVLRHPPHSLATIGAPDPNEFEPLIGRETPA